MLAPLLLAWGRNIPAEEAELPSPLRHRYFALRHGESEANVAGMIISDPEVGVKEFGLTERGQEDVRRTAGQFAKLLKDDAAAGEGEDLRSRVVVVASDFKRTRETAEVFSEALAGAVMPQKVRLETALRERFFGRLEAGPNKRYQEVWDRDRRDPSATPFSAESALDVRQRTVSLIARLEAELPEGSIVVLVSHGDALQILQTAFNSISAAEHRSLRHLDPAEVRELVPRTAPALR